MRMRTFFEPQEPAWYSAVIALAAILTLGAALFFQYVLGYTPCALCYMQRWPYYSGIPLAIAITALIQPSGLLRRYARVALAGIAVVFAVSVVLAVHHAGVEWGWWQGLAACSPGLGGGRAADVFSLDAPRFISCSAASWRFLGLSFAGWNAVISLGIVGVAVAGVWRLRR